MVCLCTLIDDEMKIKVLFNCQEIIISLYRKCLWVGLRHEIDLCLCRSRAPIEGVVTKMVSEQMFLVGPVGYGVIGRITLNMVFFCHH